MFSLAVVQSHFSGSLLYFPYIEKLVGTYGKRVCSEENNRVVIMYIHEHFSSNQITTENTAMEVGNIRLNPTYA